MPNVYLHLLSLLALLFSARLRLAQTIDTEAATAYWQLTDALRRNEPLTDAAWQAFLALPANNVYVRECFNGEEDVQRCRRAMEVVYPHPATTPCCKPSFKARPRCGTTCC